MKYFLEQAKAKRTFVKSDIQINSWNDIEQYFTVLAEAEINSVADLQTWLHKSSELSAVLEEDFAWRYIAMNCNTEDKQAAKSFQVFVSEIQPKIHEFANVLDSKILSSKYLNYLGNDFFVMIREIHNRVELFCEKNIPIFAELEQEEQEYGSIVSQMTVEVNGETKTLQQAAVFLKELDRSVRESVYVSINNRRLQDKDALNDLLTKLIEKRHTIAQNAGFDNFRDYKFRALGRFDYTKEDCFDFHISIQSIVPKIVNEVMAYRKQKLGLDTLKPWDLEVDVNKKPPLKPFSNSEDLLEKSIACFNLIKPEYAQVLSMMKEHAYLDLDSRIGKAPGGFNYPLYESNIPFIFMNAAGTLRDVETLMHEGGHAIHSRLSSTLPFVEMKSLPSEVAELASMSMELISMEYWHCFFSDKEELRRAKQSQLEGILTTISWIAIVDKFQHFLYENPTHSVEERTAAWNEILKEFENTVVDYTNCEDYRASAWQKQLHIFEVPFYYIEYGIAQLGAIAMWKNYKENPQETLQKYEAFLKLGYSKTIPEIYEAAGIKFDFSYGYVKDLLDFLYKELKMLYKS